MAVNGMELGQWLSHQDDHTRQQFWVDLLFHQPPEDLVFVQNTARRLQSYHRVRQGELPNQSVLDQTEALHGVEAKAFAAQVQDQLHGIEEHQRELAFAAEQRELKRQQNELLNGLLGQYQTATQKVLAAAETAVKLEANCGSPQVHAFRVRPHLRGSTPPPPSSPTVPCEDLCLTHLNLEEERIQSFLSGLAACLRPDKGVLHLFAPRLLYAGMTVLVASNPWVVMSSISGASMPVAYLTPFCSGTRCATACRLICSYLLLEAGLELVNQLRLILGRTVTVSNDVIAHPADLAFDARLLGGISPEGRRFFLPTPLATWRRSAGLLHELVVAGRRWLQSQLDLHGDAIIDHHWCRIITHIVGWNRWLALEEQLRPVLNWLQLLRHDNDLSVESWAELIRLLETAMAEKRHALAIEDKAGDEARKEARILERLAAEHDEARTNAQAKLKGMSRLIPRLQRLIEVQEDLDLDLETAMDELDEEMVRWVEAPLLSKHQAGDAAGLASLTYADRIDLLIQGDVDTEAAVEALTLERRSFQLQPESVIDYALGFPVTSPAVAWRVLTRAEQDYLDLLDLHQWLNIQPLVVVLRDRGLTHNVIDRALRTLQRHEGGDRPPLRALPRALQEEQEFLTLEEFVAMFWDWLQLIEVHEAFFNDLLAGMDELAIAEENEDASGTLGALDRLAQALLELAETLRPTLQTLLRNVENGLHRFGAAMERSALLRSFLCRAKYSQHAPTALSFWRLHLLPLQRISFYRWCCGELLRLTAAPTQRQALGQAMDTFGKLCRGLDRTAATSARTAAATLARRAGADDELPSDAVLVQRFVVVARERVVLHDDSDLVETYGAAEEEHSVGVMRALGEALVAVTPSELHFLEVWEECVAVGQAAVTRLRTLIVLPRHVVEDVYLSSEYVQDLDLDGVVLCVTMTPGAQADSNTDAMGGDEAWEDTSLVKLYHRNPGQLEALEHVLLSS
ncbi:uncharacterized protein MONBRDRAFT_7019 [Monosiga brevicollis MX1]|uniref:DH domain-containing protein n=1 Tax=Monosiga brevicollis TaxID=81824 RepID=A9UVN6_MONBE|nr:uncharacterized protein MONBRDRAFT_7019 [Monosiga brevicollis MX1]EDQ90615.1 predicted protein [Monosiga brevicollis MX1]|eukprot:XP_001744666.1 hypothetical protein [Monosiga brevicollis MX1]